MEPFIGQIQPYGFNFPPQGWAFCDGQILSIAQNTALFSLLGTTYGGNGQTTFALPDLRGRSIVHPGNGPGLSPISQGERAGAENVSILVSNLPAHTHAVRVSSNSATQDEPTPGGHIATPGTPIYIGGGTGNVILAADSTAPVGSNTPVNIRNPYLGIYYSIALFGIYPSRN